MAAAVELRTDPVQCAFKPLLDPNTPALCGSGGTETQVWVEDFEDGLAGWTRQPAGGLLGRLRQARGRPRPRPPAGTPVAWPSVRRPTSVQCSGRREQLLQPRLASPARRSASRPATSSPRLSFDHYVSTETGYDGGNVKVSVNGGAFTVIPAAAYTFNKPTTLTDA